MTDLPIERIDKHEIKTAILVDGGFYKTRAQHLWGAKPPAERAEELQNYCFSLLWNKYEKRNLYRIFYYDCPPSSKKVYHPLLNKTTDLGKSDVYKWQTVFLNELRSKRKFALRLGELSDEATRYMMNYDSMKSLLHGTTQVSDLAEKDFRLDISQKGVDMRIGVDITYLALKKQVDQIILISGDSDFVPAAKLARREGIDMILAPMGATIKANLHEHIDGLVNKTTLPTHKQQTTAEAELLEVTC